MIDSTTSRILAVGLLLCGLAGLSALHAVQPTNPEAGMYPQSEELVMEPDRYVGERVTAYGIVRDTDPLVAVVEYGDRDVPYEVVGADVDARPGDRLRVHGVLDAPGRIRAIEAFAVPPQGLWYAFGSSFLAGLWVLGRLVAHWTLDPRRLALSPREQVWTARRIGDRIRTKLE